MNPKRSAFLIYLATAPVATQTLDDTPRIFVAKTCVEGKAAALGSVPPPDCTSVVRRHHTRFPPAEVTTSGWALNVSNCP